MLTEGTLALPPFAASRCLASASSFNSRWLAASGAFSATHSGTVVAKLTLYAIPSQELLLDAQTRYLPPHAAQLAGHRCVQRKDKR